MLELICYIKKDDALDDITDIVRAFKSLVSQKDAEQDKLVEEENKAQDGQVVNAEEGKAVEEKDEDDPDKFIVECEKMHEQDFAKYRDFQIREKEWSDILQEGEDKFKEQSDTLEVNKFLVELNEENKGD